MERSEGPPFARDAKRTMIRFMAIVETTQELPLTSTADGTIPD